MKLVEKFNGIITDIEIPSVFDKYGYIDEEMIKITKIVVKTNDGFINIFVNRDDRLKEYSYNKEVLVEKYINEDGYENYLKALNRYINNNFSSLPEKEKEKLYNNYKFDVDEYNKQKKILIFYGIEGLDIA